MKKTYLKGRLHISYIAEKTIIEYITKKKWKRMSLFEKTKAEYGDDAEQFIDDIKSGKIKKRTEPQPNGIIIGD